MPPVPGYDRTCTFIDNEKAKKVSNVIIARRLFSFDTPIVFEGREDQGFDIFNKVANHFRISLLKVRVVGSAQLGYSFIKKTPFELGSSDLDLAIIDETLFRQYCEISYGITDGYKDLTKFPRVDGKDTSQDFYKNLAKGFFRPDQMPTCIQKTAWWKFFGELTREYQSLFRTINCALYMSPLFFECKQAGIVESYLETKI